MFRLLAIGFAVLPFTMLQAQDAPPKGEVIKFVFEQSKVFPGTTRDVWVYVPKQYDGTTPAYVYVNQDGVQYKAPEVFDKLIHSGRESLEFNLMLRLHDLFQLLQKPRINRSHLMQLFDGEAVTQRYAQPENALSI